MIVLCSIYSSFNFAQYSALIYDCTIHYAVLVSLLSKHLTVKITQKFCDSVTRVVEGTCAV